MSAAVGCGDHVEIGGAVDRRHIGVARRAGATERGVRAAGGEGAFHAVAGGGGDCGPAQADGVVARGGDEVGGCALEDDPAAVVAGAGLLISLGLASFGITALVAKGYGTIAWGYLVVFMIPLLTVGVFKIWRKTG